MLECFSYGLTRFSDEYYYLSVNNLYDAGRYWICLESGCGAKNTRGYCTECGGPAPAAKEDWKVDQDAPPDTNILKDQVDWKPVVLHKNFSDKANGAVEQVIVENGNDYPFAVRVRAIRRF